MFFQLCGSSLTKNRIWWDGQVSTNFSYIVYSLNAESLTGLCWSCLISSAILFQGYPGQPSGPYIPGGVPQGYGLGSDQAAPLCSLPPTVNSTAPSQPPQPAYIRYILNHEMSLTTVCYSSKLDISGTITVDDIDIMIIFVAYYQQFQLQLIINSGL